MKEYKLKINGNDYNVVINDVQESVASVEVNGSNYKVEFETKPAAASAPTAGGTTVSSPLPGVILEINVKEGDTVKNGEKIMVLEAMKMENVIEATADGVIKSIKVNKGDSVMEGTPLAIIG